MSGGSQHVLVFCGGDAPRLDRVRSLPVDAFVVAADSGADYALAAERRVDVLVGDLDSVAPATLAAAERAGTRVVRHPRDKNATDLALALDLAVARAPQQITVVGGHGGRLDHLVANVLLLASDDYAGVPIDAQMGEATVTIVRGARTLRGAPAQTVTLLAVAGPAVGVTTTGLRWPLRDATVPDRSSLGVSNEFEVSTASVTVRRGVLVAIQPG
ncbi:MAG: thiamine diphosphokinase [Acidimicrobiia bacterium]|nr:thiamine diphosphokinase [Acidimicrobiia bacterium]